MKVRVTVIEADDVAPSEVAEVVARIFQVPTLTPALPAPAPAPEPVLTGREPREATMQLAKMPSAWRPRARARKGIAARSGRDEEPSSRALRPTQPEKFMCDQCGEDRPEGKDGRARCAKCGARAWAKVGGKSDPAELATDADDE